MTWARFEDHKLRSTDRFMVTIVTGGAKYPRNAYLAFNQKVRQQVIRDAKYCDVFLDYPGQRIGLKFYAKPADHNSFKIFGAGGGGRAAARITASGFLVRWGLLKALGGKSYRQELRSEVAENIWWFTLAPLLKARRAA